MDLTPHVEALQHHLLAAAEPGGEQARDLAALLVTSLDPFARLMLLDALADASNEITRELAPGSVEVRLRGREPEFVVTPAPRTSTPKRSVLGDVIATSRATASVQAPIADHDDGGTSRITLRMPEQLKLRIEQAAGADGVSVNSWLVRTLAAARRVDRRPPGVAGIDPPDLGRATDHRVGALAAPRRTPHRQARAASTHPPSSLTPKRRRKETTMPTFETPAPIASTSTSSATCGSTPATATTPSSRSRRSTRRRRPTSRRPRTRSSSTPTASWSSGRRSAGRGSRRSVEVNPSTVTIEAPTGSRLDATTGLGDIHTEGELGACRVKTAMGHLRLDHTGDLRATTVVR